jgi:hypothetical protein
MRYVSGELVRAVNGQWLFGSPANPVKAWRGEAARTGWCELSLDREFERAEAAASRVRIRPF